MRLAQLVTDFPEISELDINPLLLMEQEAYAVDARIAVKRSEISSPLHLVISPYPNQDEITTTTKGGKSLFVRPIKPEDEPLLVDLFQNLSPKSIYFRFFSPLKSLPHTLLARFTQIDYDRDIALVALDQTQMEKEILGVARVMSSPGGLIREFCDCCRRSPPRRGDRYGFDEPS